MSSIKGTRSRLPGWMNDSSVNEKKEELTRK